jgi:hypothetical protein
LLIANVRLLQSGSAMTVFGVLWTVTVVAESRFAGTGRIHADSGGRKWPLMRRSAWAVALLVVCLMPKAVQQAHAVKRNPDALLFFVDVPGIGVGEGRCDVGRGECHGSVSPLDAATRCVPNRHSPKRNRPDRGRSADTQSPGSGNERSGISGHWATSACGADEGWTLTRPSETMHGLCESTVWGMASVSDRQIFAGAMPVSSAIPPIALFRRDVIYSESILNPPNTNEHPNIRPAQAQLIFPLSPNSGK